MAEKTVILKEGKFDDRKEDLKKSLKIAEGFV